jgi:hypothetical protein
VLTGSRDGLRYAESPGLRSRAEEQAWPRDLERLPVGVVLPAHVPPAADGRAAIGRSLARPPWDA